jgi:hypothetical protein
MQSAYVIAVLLGSCSSLSLEKHHRTVKFIDAYNQAKKADIAETHIDPWVYDKANPNVERLTLGRPDEAPKRSSYTPPLDKP